MKSTGLIQVVGKLHQAGKIIDNPESYVFWIVYGKIHNLHQVCGVFGCVVIQSPPVVCNTELIRVMDKTNGFFPEP